MSCSEHLNETIKEAMKWSVQWSLQFSNAITWYGEWGQEKQVSLQTNHILNTFLSKALQGSH